uniref:DUF167 domain-containing protein n=1 Tax=Actinokineospora bangkokensis TaxID=1193682 RepID=UPI000A0230A2|nr:DUF167 domain-containing protein [Actinokineospora bangkokensis]
MRFAIRVRPGARRTAVGGARAGALLVSVAAPAVEGKANEAVRAAVADAFGVRRRDVVITAGERSRDKVVAIDPEPPGARAVLERLLAGGDAGGSSGR